jgi:hypothetical protein
VLKYDLDELQTLIDETFYSRAQHRETDAEYESGAERKFLLNSYPEPVLLEYRQKYGGGPSLSTEDHEKLLAVDGRRKATKTKVEGLTWNY